MTRLRSAFLATMFMALAGCETQTFDPAPISKGGDQTRSEMPGLPTQNLAPGECGLFLWTQKEPRRFVFFSKASASTAMLGITDTPETISGLSVSGGLFGQFMTQQIWSRPNGQQIKLDLVPGESLENGQRLNSAQLTLIDANGWETIVPALGLRACQP